MILLYTLLSLIQTDSIFRVERQTFAMSSLVYFELSGTSRDSLQTFITWAFKEFERHDDLWSLYNPESLINKINYSSKKKSHKIDRSTQAIISFAKWAYIDSKEAFNIAIKPLLDAIKININVTPAMVQNLQKRMNLDELIVKNDKLNFNLDSMALDLNGVAVGFVLERIRAKALTNKNINSIFVNHSGDLFYINKVKNDSVPIQIDSQIKKRLIFIKSGQALSSSGNYNNYIIKAKKQIGHVINPKTGESAPRKYLVTVISSSPLLSDYKSTAILAGEALSNDSIFYESKQLEANLESLILY